MSLKVRLLFAFSSCLLAQTKVLLHQHRAVEQVASLSSGLSTQANKDAVNTMSGMANRKGSGVARFDAYEEQLVLSGGSSFPAGYIWTYVVFENQAARSAWEAWATPLGHFEASELELLPGVQTMTEDNPAVQVGTGPYPIFFFVTVAAEDFEKTKAAFANIVVPTRAESGAVRYDNGCSKNGNSAGAFCFENVWYNELPTAQNNHMASKHMETFFGDTSDVVMTWGMKTLQRMDLQAASAGVQLVRLSTAPKNDANLAALKTMSAMASAKGSGVVRFDAYEELLVLSGGSSFAAMKIWTYIVFTGQAALSAWTEEANKQSLGTFTGSDMALPVGVQTLTQSAKKVNTPPNPIFFWVHVQTKDFEKTKAAFAKIVEPTRAEDGTLRYDQACSLSGDDAFCYENVWYETLPGAQDAHMASAHMGVFFGDTAGVVMGWGMSTLKVLDKPAPVGAIAQYLRVADRDTMKNTNPDCNFFEESDLARKVPDKCCDLTQWPQGSGASQTPPNERLSASSGDKKWPCYVQERVAAPGTYTRNFLGCEAGILQLSEGCAPTGTGMGNGYPMNETFALTKFEDGSSTSCNCDPPGYRGDGCFVAFTSYIAGVGNDKTANFVKLSGNEGCQGESSDYVAAPPAPPAPAPTVATNPLMQYMVLNDISEIKNYQPECDSSFAFEEIGRKMPDSCCDADSWKGAPSMMSMDPDITKKVGEDEETSCYVRVAPWPFKGDWIRNYIGCEGGKLIAHEECIPSTTPYVTAGQYALKAGGETTYGYPMNETYGMTQWEDGTAESCNCNPLAPFNQGPGCYIASAQLAQLGGNFPGVYVHVDGTCPNDDAPAPPAPQDVLR